LSPLGGETIVRPSKRSSSTRHRVTELLDGESLREKLREGLYALDMEWP